MAVSSSARRRHIASTALCRQRRRTSSHGQCRTFAAALLASSCLLASPALATDSTWVGGNGGDPNEWVEPNNWTGTTIPDGTANFDATAVTTTVANDGGLVTIGTVSFAAGAPAFTLNVNNAFIVTGSGILNASSNIQTFTVNDTLVFNNSSSVASNVAINNSGFVFFQFSSSAGNATVTNNSIMQFSNSASAGASNITNNVQTDFFDSSTAGIATITNAAAGTLTFNNSAGAGSSTINNAGDVEFNNTSTAGTATITNTGTLRFNNTATTGTATIADNGSLFFNYSGAVTVAAAISGSGNAEVVAGTPIVTTFSSVGGTVTIDSGATMQWGDGSGSVAFLFGGTGVVDNGALVLNYGGGGLGATIPISGSGTFTLQSGSLNNAGVSTYTGSTTIDSGAPLLLSGGGSIANSSVVVDNGIFDIASTTAGTSIVNLTGSGKVNLGSQTLTITNASGIFSGVLADGGIALPLATGGSLTIAAGSETLTGTNTFTGATTINGGATLQLGAGGTTGTVAGNVVDNGLVQFNYGGSVISNNTFSGSGAVEVVAGTVVETGFGGVSGNVTIDPGATLQWGNAGVGLLSGANIVDNGAFVIDFGGSGLGSGIPVTGTGSLEIKSGNVAFAAANTYTGTTTIDSGALFALNSAGSISNSSLVTDNGTFDISGEPAGTSITTLAGTGGVSLGAQTLTITNASGTFGGVLADGGITPGTGGGLTIAGGTQALTGTNTFTGNTTINGGATLALGAGGTTGTVAGNVVDNGLVQFNYGGSVISNNTFSGSGAVEVVAGTVVETGFGGVSGNVTIDPGATLQWGNAGVGVLSGANIVDNGAFVIDFGTSGLGSGIPVIGTGSLEIKSGNVAFAAANTYTGTTTIDSGALFALNGTGSISNSSLVTDNGTFDISGTTAGTSITTLAGTGGVSLGAQTLTITNASGTFGGVLADGGITPGTGGGLTIAAGSETLTGANTYTGPTTVDSGATLHAGSTSAFGILSAVQVNATALLDLNNFSLTLGSLAGAGSVTLGSATLTTNGNNASTLFSGVISGSGGLTKAGTGVLTLSAVNTYTGPTTINAGTLQMGAANALTASTDVTVASGATFALNNFNQTIGSLAGAGNVTLGSATLSTNADNASTTFSGVMSGTGGLTKIGTGTLILTGASTYSGVTLVNGGVLDVNGSIANSAVTVNQTATLKGTGTVGAITAGNGATVAPGNSIGTLHVAGNVSFGPNSVYQVEVNAAGQSDLIAAGGAATLTGGTVQVLPLPGLYGATTVYPILTATGGVTGTFASVTSANTLLLPTLVYKPNEVDLSLAVLSLATFAQTPNQIATANAIQAGGFGSALFAAIGLLPPAAIPAALDATSGEIHASMHSLMLESSDTLRQGVLDHLYERQHKTGGGLWGRLFGSWGAIESDGNAATLNTNYSGITVGMDTPVSDDILLGGDGGYGQLQGFIGQSRGSSLVSDAYHAALYASFTHGPFSLNGAAIGSWGAIRTDRAVRFPGFSDRDTAKQTGRTAQLFAEAAWDCPLGDFDVQPFLNGGWAEAFTGAFSETGGLAALTGTKGSSDETFMTLGTRLSTDVTLANGGVITPNATLGWLHGFRALTPSRFLTFEATSTSFTVLGVPLDEDQAVIDLAISSQPIRGLTASIGYDGILSGHVRDNGLHASLMWAF
jgi:outer membrane autotransporter protein